MFNIEITDNLENTFDSNMMAKSDLANYHNNLENEYDDSKLPRTSHNHKRNVVVNNIKTQNQQTSNTKSDIQRIHNFKGDNVLSEISHKSGNYDKNQNFHKDSSMSSKNEIYLNKNSAEENPPDSYEEM